MFEEKVNRIVLGTVQFGMSYGIMNRYGQVPVDEVEDILTTANSAGIHSLDTSGDYGHSEQVIGRIIKNNPNLVFDIYSKNASDDIVSSFNNSIRLLSSMYAYSLHYFTTYENNHFVWDEFCKLKYSGLVKKIGISIYTIAELEFALDHLSGLDIVQLPANILDRRFYPYFDLLVNRNIEIHVRSVFLQGLFFKDPKRIPNNLSALKGPITAIQNYCKKKQIRIEDFALNNILSIPQVSKIIIGVHSSEQLKTDIESLKYNNDKEDADFVQSLNISDERLLNPSNWK